MSWLKDIKLMACPLLKKGQFYLLNTQDLPCLKCSLLRRFKCMVMRW